MAGAVAVVEGSAEAMEQGDSEAVAVGDEPMQTEGVLGEEGVVAIDEGAAGEAAAAALLQVHVAMEAQPGQSEQAEVRTPMRDWHHQHGHTGLVQHGCQAWVFFYYY